MGSFLGRFSGRPVGCFVGRKQSASELARPYSDRQIIPVWIWGGPAVCERLLVNRRVRHVWGRVHVPDSRIDQPIWLKRVHKMALVQSGIIKDILAGAPCSKPFPRGHNGSYAGNMRRSERTPSVSPHRDIRSRVGNRDQYARGKIVNLRTVIARNFVGIVDRSNADYWGRIASSRSV